MCKIAGGLLHEWRFFIMEQNKEKKKIEVVSGNVDDLNISEVYSHIPLSKPKTNKKIDKKIIIPKESKQK